MTVQEIKQAVDKGNVVCYMHAGYQVIKDTIGQYFIIYLQNKHCIGLTWQDGVTLNGAACDFFIADITVNLNSKL